MKILLIHPPVTDEERYGKFAKAGSVLPPLGLLYMSSYLKKKGYKQVNFVDGLGENLTFAELKKLIQKIGPDLAGITSATLVYHRAVETARLMKEINPKVITVLGGPHATAFKSKIFETDKVFDIVVYGEGEHTLLDIVDTLNSGRSLADVRGLVYRNDSKIVANSHRPYIQNLDEIPFPDRDLLPRNWQNLYRPNLARIKRWPVTSMITSRGCPFRCAFCDRNTFGKKFRAHSAEYVVDEIEMLVKKYGIREIAIEDDTFSINKKRVVQICEQLIRKNLNLTWSCLARVNTVDKSLLELMKRAGCWLIGYGLESGSVKVLEKMKKDITLEQARQAIHWSNKIGLHIRGFFIIGHPGETPDSVMETIKYAKSLPLHSATFCLMFPIPNTETYNMATSGEYGSFKMNFDQFSGHPNDPNFVPRGFTKKMLIAYHRKAYRNFYLRPSLFFKHLKMIRTFADIRRYLLLFCTAFDVFLKQRFKK